MWLDTFPVLSHLLKGGNPFFADGPIQKQPLTPKIGSSISDPNTSLCCFKTDTVCE